MNYKAGNIGRNSDKQEFFTANTDSQKLNHRHQIISPIICSKTESMQRVSLGPYCPEIQRPVKPPYYYFSKQGQRAFLVAKYMIDE